MKSFRRRIIFWTSVIAGVVMLGFTLGSLYAYERLKLAQIDSTIELMATRPVPPPIHAPHWEMVQRDFTEQVRKQFGTVGIMGVYANMPETTLSEDSLDNLENLFGARENWPEVEGELAEDPAEFDRMRPGGRPRLGRGSGPMRVPITLSIFNRDGVNDDVSWRVGVAKHEGFNIVLAISRDSGHGEAAAFRNALMIVFPASIFVLSLCIWIYVTKAISPLNQLGGAMEKLSVTGLRNQVEVDGEYEEFELLIARFNALRERLDKSFEQATRFSADAAHELKTPLTVIQGQIEAALQSAQAGSKEQIALASILDEVFRLKSITRKLLILAQADAGKLEVKLETVELGKLVDDTVSTILDTDSELKIQVNSDVSVKVECDVSLTRQILINLFSNAHKYRWPLDSEVEVNLTECEGLGVLEILNGCQAINEERRAAVFDRFARMDLSRNRETEGVGLGLSIAREFAKAQGGTLELMATGRSDQIGFRLSLPVG